MPTFFLLLSHEMLNLPMGTQKAEVQSISKWELKKLL